MEYNRTHFVLRAWIFGELQTANLMGNVFGHIASDYPARSNVVNNYIPMRRRNRPRGLEGKEVRVEEKSPEILMELIEHFSEEDALVADFFVGSGAPEEAAMRVNRKWIGCDHLPIVFTACACKQRLINYFSFSICLGLISPPCNVPERLFPIGSDRLRQLEQKFLVCPSSWSIIPPPVDLRRSDMSILEQDIVGNGGICYVTESSIPEIISQDQFSKDIFASKPIKKGTFIGAYWVQVLRCLRGDKIIPKKSPFSILSHTKTALYDILIVQEIQGPGNQ